jgi:hypothetical protein
MFVPRFYDKPAAEVATSTVTVDDARLVVARANRLASWEAFLEWHNEEAPMHQEGWNRYDSPAMKALAIIRTSDIPALERLLDEHPELLRPVDRFRHRGGGGIMFSAVYHEEETRSEDARRVGDYLVSRGLSLVDTLNYMMLGLMGYGWGTIREQQNRRKMDYLIARGADPAWVAPNGYTVLEHALTRNRSRDAIEILLEYSQPRKALWVAAALGNVAELRAYVRDDGTLTSEARKQRPDFVALGPGGGGPFPPNATDLEILAEAFFVALTNERYESLDFFLDRGFPVDYSYWGYTPFHWGLNSRNCRMVEYFVKRGARADIDGSTAEQKDQWLFEADPGNDDSRRIYELSGGTNYDAVLARYNQRQTQPPVLSPGYTQLLTVARDDAVRAGKAVVSDENLFVAFLRDERAFPASILGGYGVDLKQLRADYGDRLKSGTATPPELPFAEDAQATIDAAIARRMTMHWRQVGTHDVLRALLLNNESPVVQMLVERGLTLAGVREALDRM